MTHRLRSHTFRWSLSFSNPGRLRISIGTIKPNHDIMVHCNPMRWGLSIILLAGIFSPPPSLWAVELGNYTLQFLPHAISFRSPMADPLASIPSFKSFTTSSPENKIGKVAAGMTFGLIRVSTPALSVQVNLEGGVFTRFDLDDVVIAQTVDFRVGFPLEISRNKPSGVVLQIMPYHTSSHLLDDAIFDEDNHLGDDQDSGPIRSISSYSRDVIRILMAYRFNPLNRVYGGISYADDGINFKSFWNYQMGSELFTTAFIIFEYDLRLYTAGDIQFRGETDHSLMMNLQTGFLLRRIGKDHGIRISLEYFIGHAPEGQLIGRDRERNVGFGASFDL